MIEGFRCKETERIFRREYSRKLPTSIQKVAFRKLRMLNRSGTVEDLRVPPGNRLEALSGTRKGQHSIRINDAWRICFVWRDGNAHAVEIVNYHKGWTMKKIPPVHPGEILLEEFMKPFGLSQNQLGKALNVAPRRINEIVHGRRSVTADTALRLARFFGNSASFWLGLQMDYDLDVAADKSAADIRHEVHQMAFAWR
jgi:addiction module HigA family antidote